MGLLNIIRRMKLREKQSIREISRHTGLSRNTIAKYLNAGTIEPTFTVPERPSKLDPYADKLAGWLKTEAGRSRKQRRTLKQLHADLVVLGFTGSYGRVAAFAGTEGQARHHAQHTAARHGGGGEGGKQVFACHAGIVRRPARPRPPGTSAEHAGDVRDGRGAACGASGRARWRSCRRPPPGARAAGHGHK